MFALVGLVASISVVNKENLFLITFKHKSSRFLLYQVAILCSVGISYLRFLQNNANITKVLLFISCDLEAMDYLVEYSLIRTFRLLKQILRSLRRLFQENKTLDISNSSLNLNCFLCPVIVRVIESSLLIYFGVFFLSSTRKIMLISLIDYF